MSGINILYIGGTFDLLHYGHIELFKKCKKLGIVIVSLNNDNFVKRYKREPIIPFKQRKSMLESCRYVDFVIENTNGEDSKPAILKSMATHIVHGNDWTGESLMKQMGLTKDWLKKNNIKMIYFPYTKTTSTTNIIRRINKLYGGDSNLSSQK